MVHHKKHKKSLVIFMPLLVAVSVLALPGVAGASGWAGKMTVEVTSGGSGRVVGWGLNNGRNEHCPTKPWEGQARAHAGSATHDSGTLKITVEPSTVAEAGICASQLADGLYDINFLNTGTGDYVGVEPVREYLHDCMYGGNTLSFKIGTITVTSGFGVADVTIDKPGNSGQPEVVDLPGTESAVCVAHPTSTHDGMQNPITVI